MKNNQDNEEIEIYNVIWNGRGESGLGRDPQIMTPFFEWADGMFSVQIPRLNEPLELRARRAEIELKHCLLRDVILGAWKGPIPKEMYDAKSPLYLNPEHPICNKIIAYNIDQWHDLWVGVMWWTQNVFYDDLYPAFDLWFHHRVKPTNELIQKQKIWNRVLDVEKETTDEQKEAIRIKAQTQITLIEMERSDEAKRKLIENLKNPKTK